MKFHDMFNSPTEIKKMNFAIALRIKKRNDVQDFLDKHKQISYLIINKYHNSIITKTIIIIYQPQDVEQTSMPEIYRRWRILQRYIGGDEYCRDISAVVNIAEIYRRWQILQRYIGGCEYGFWHRRWHPQLEWNQSATALT